MATKKRAAKKSRTRKSGGRKRRTPAQIAATKKMLAANKRARGGKKSMSRGKRRARKNPEGSLIMDAYGETSRHNPRRKKSSSKRSRASGGKGLAGRVSRLEKRVDNHDAAISSIRSNVAKAMSSGRKALGLKSGKKRSGMSKRAKKAAHDFKSEMAAISRASRSNPSRSKRGKTMSRAELERILAR